MKSSAIGISLGVILFALAPGICSTAQSTPQHPAQATTPSPSSEQSQSDTAAKPATEQDTVPDRIPRGKKLVLTDGTYLVVREYSVEGDRVRYWSVERSAWEEIPAKLVDWDATRKAEADQAQQDAKLKAKIQATDIAEATANIDVDLSLEIKPGLFLPDGEGFYILEDRTILEMKQSLAVADQSAAREAEKILSGIPIIPSKDTLEVPGEHAAMRTSITEPEFYMRPADSRQPQFRLLQLRVTGGHRIVDTVKSYLSGEQVHTASDIEFQTWIPATGVFRYTVEQPLKPGEYAFVEMTKEGISGYVWDFGIDGPRAKSKK